MQLKQLHK